MKLKHLVEELQYVAPFENPKVALEQYATPPELAARMLCAIESDYGDIAGKQVLDLGCGTGMLSIGSALLGSEYVLGVDVDESALKAACSNRDELEVDVDFVQANITSDAAMPIRQSCTWDTVVTNPPFGAQKGCKGADANFLRVALAMNPTVVYSLHKSSTREHWRKKAEDWDCAFEVVAAMKFKLPKTQKFHKKSSLAIDVDLLRFAPR